MRTKTRSILLGSTLFATATCFGGQAFAQTTPPATAPDAQDQTPPDAATDGKDIVITGTLIRNPNLTASSPVAVIGSDELQLRQTNTAEEVLRELPGAVPSLGSAVNNGSVGAAFADLRGLGNFRNVVLLDGTRIAPAGLEGRVDLNNIPLALIQRVDTLTGGAATTYGADAVSGVINFITRRDFSGVEASLSNQITERGDGRGYRADLTMGANFDDSRGNVVLSVGYQHSDPVYQGSRRISQNQYTSTTGAAGGSGTTVPGRFTLPTAFNTITPAGNLRPYSGATDAFNFAPYNLFQTPFERFNIYGSGRYDISDSVEVYARGMFSKNTVNTVVAPSGVFGQLLTIPVSSPFLPAAARAQFCANNDFDPNTPGVQTITPAQCNLAATATSATDPNFRAFTTTVGRRTPEVGTRNSQFTTNYFDYRAGVKLNVTKSISLDVSGGYGESENRQTLDGYVLISRLRTAVYTTSATSCNLGASPTINNPTVGLPPLASAGAGTSAGPGCVPVNIFGANGSITPAMVPYLTGSSTTAVKTTLAQARALLSGDLGFSSPWADTPIGFALGGEYRKYTARQEADQLAQTAGELGGAGGAVLNFRGAYDVKEAYGELIVPLVADKPLFKSLTLEGGLRYSSYSVEAAGNPKYDTTTYKIGGSWEPVDGFKVRGNYQRAVRAPNIAELFSPTNTGLSSLRTDPCRGANPVTNANLRAVCLAQGAPLSSIGSIVDPTASQPDGTFAGGTYLRPEVSNSFTAGVVFQPRFLSGFSFTADYYNIVVTKAISQPTPDDLVSACFGAAPTYAAAVVSNPSCGLFARNPITGGLDGDPATTKGLIFPSSNSGKILTDGIDVGVNYRHSFGAFKLNLSFLGNWTSRSIFQSTVPGSVIPPGYPGAGQPLAPTIRRECVGLYSQSCGSPGSAGPSSTAGSLQPEFTWNQRTTVTFGKIDLSLLWRHISPMNAECCAAVFSGPTLTGGVLDGEPADFTHIPAYNYFDLATRFSVNENFTMTLTVANLFDKDPPNVGTNVGTTAFNSGNTYPSTYDTLGRRYAVGVTLKF